MTGDTKKKILKKPSRRTVIAVVVVLIACAAAWLVFGQNIVGEKNIRFSQLDEDSVPKTIETDVVPEYRELERALGCLVDGKVYVLVTRGEKPTAGYGASVEKITMEKTDGGTNMKVYASFTEPEGDKAVSQVTTYPYTVAETELTSLPDTIELVVKYEQ